MTQGRDVPPIHANFNCTEFDTIRNAAGSNNGALDIYNVR